MQLKTNSVHIQIYRYVESKPMEKDIPRSHYSQNTAMTKLTKVDLKINITRDK